MRLEALIDNEIASGRGRMILKMNGLVDVRMTENDEQSPAGAAAAPSASPASRRSKWTALLPRRRARARRPARAARCRAVGSGADFGSLQIAVTIIVQMCANYKTVLDK